MATPAATFAAAAPGLLPAPHGPLRVRLKTAVFFPFRSTIALSLSISSSCPASPHPPRRRRPTPSTTTRRSTRGTTRARRGRSFCGGSRGSWRTRGSWRRSAGSAPPRGGSAGEHFEGPYPFDDEQEKR
ncbi:hypothetical protein ACP4OV_018578 [Aristida adscensionis]